MVVSRGWVGGGEMGSCLMGTEFLFCKVSTFWRLVVYNNVNILNTTKLYTYKQFRWQVICYVHFTTIKNKKYLLK